MALISLMLLAGCHCGPIAPSSSEYAALFNGHDLTGWKGLAADPPTRAKMTPEQLAAAQATADQRMHEHWHVEHDPHTGEGVLAFDGRGDNLCTSRDFGDFELWVDWKIEPGGDSGIYLRGTPQVQIWDNPIGSGGLYNNERHRSQPLAVVDRPIAPASTGGEGGWNTFHITMIGERVSVDLNGTRVVEAVPMENYWEREKPIYATGAIELQSHGTRLWFRRINVREFPR